MLCSTVVEAVNDALQSFHDRRAAYFYFDFQEAEKQEFETFVRSLLRQLIAVEETLPQHIITMYTTFRDKGHSPSTRDLKSSLSHALANANKETYIILDALDEFPQQANTSKRKELLELLTSLVNHHSSRLHVLATSRDETDIREAFEEVAHHSICLGAAKVDPDIRTYVRSCLEDSGHRFKNFPVSVKIEIEEGLTQRARGM